jgi:hypothetical protein
MGSPEQVGFVLKEETERIKVKPQEQEITDQSVYSDDPEDTQEDDMEEDLALLSDDDDLWQNSLSSFCVIREAHVFRGKSRKGKLNFS